jgi:hypothetical protein
MTPIPVRTLADTEKLGEIDVSLKDRLAVFDPDGTLVADARDVSELLGGREESLMAAFWTRFRAAAPSDAGLSDVTVAQATPRAVANMKLKFAELDNPLWAEGVRDYAKLTRANPVLITALRAAVSAA